MKKQNPVFGSSLLALILVLTLACNFVAGTSPISSPSPTAANEATVPPAPVQADYPPILVQDIQLQITNVSKVDSYTSPIAKQTYTPADPSTTFLFVQADMLAGDLQAVSELTVSVVDDSGNFVFPSISTILATGKAEWIFPIKKISKSLTMIFPENQLIPLEGADAPANSGENPPASNVPPTWEPPKAIANTNAIAGTWKGTASNGSFSFEITITVNWGCVVGVVCATFEIPSMPCSGTYKLTGVDGKIYRVEGGNFDGSCTEGATDSLELLPAGTLMYRSRHPSYGESSGVLVKTGN
ncbi:MAG: hypothetical protein HY867_12920 [Chloroflexi bacterium]|nr:hypothetical protein [Chloroflexota bacterium]